MIGTGSGGWTIAMATAAVAVLDKLSRGVLLLDAAGVVLAGNRAVQSMLAGRGTFAVRSGRLEFTDRTANERFGRFLAHESDADGGRSLVLQIAAPRPRGAPRPGGCHQASRARRRQA